MNKLKLELFDSAAEIADFIPDGSKKLEIDLGSEIDGYLLFGHLYTRVEGRVCTLDLSRLPDGEYEPKLVFSDRTLTVPTLRIEYGLLCPVEYDAEYIRALSLRQRRTESDIAVIKRRLDLAEKKIWGESIF